MHISCTVVEPASDRPHSPPDQRSVRARDLRATLRFALAAAMSLILARAAATEVYKSRDAEGRLVFSDQAPEAPAERIKVEPPPPSSGKDRARLEAQQETWQREDAARKERDRAKAQEQAALAAERAKRCSAARSQAAMFGYDGRRFHLDPSGNRIYYSAQEIDQKREEARRDMAQFCTPVSAR